MILKRIVFQNVTGVSEIVDISEKILNAVASFPSHNFHKGHQIIIFPKLPHYHFSNILIFISICKVCLIDLSREQECADNCLPIVDSLRIS